MSTDSERPLLLPMPVILQADVQALAQAVDLPRQGAVNSLRYTGGDLTSAFKVHFVRVAFYFTSF